MLRSACLEDVGRSDEEAIIFMEDVDYSDLCRPKGWELWYSLSSILYQQYHGGSSQELCETIPSCNTVVMRADGGAKFSWECCARKTEQLYQVVARD